MNKLFIIINLISLFILIPNSFAQNTPPKLKIGQAVGYEYDGPPSDPQKRAGLAKCSKESQEADRSFWGDCVSMYYEKIFVTGVFRGMKDNEFKNKPSVAVIRTPNCEGNIDPSCGIKTYREDVAIITPGTCYKGKCIGATVPVGDNSTFGRIIGIYENGDFEIKSNGKFARVTLSDLQMAVSGLIKAHDSINSDLALYFISPELRPEPKVNDSLRGFLKVDRFRDNKQKNEQKNGEESKGI